MKIRFNVTGMTCAACSARVEKVTSNVPGVDKAEVNLLAGTMQVEAQDASVTGDIIRAVQDAGYGASVPGEKRESRGKQEKENTASRTGTPESGKSMMTS